MKTRTCSALPSPASQRGAATLLVVLALLLGMAIITITTSRTGIVEQKITGNDIRAKGVHEAAEAGLEYAIAWAGKNKIRWTTCGTSTLVDFGVNGGGNCPPSIPTDLVGNDSGSFALSMQYRRTLPDNGYIHVISTAIQPDNNSKATADTWIKPGGVLTEEGALPPPMVTDGCITNFTGTPDLYPKWTDLNGNGIQDPNELGPAFITSSTTAVDTCLDPGHLTTNGGTRNNNMLFPDWDGDGIGTLWEYYFSVTQAQFQASASTTLNTAGGRYWITSTGNWGGTTYGSQDDPVIIVFANGCPKPLGTTIVYGILFFLDGTTSGCSGLTGGGGMNGWGQVTIYGSLGVTGGMAKLNANTKIYGIGSSMNPMPKITEIPIDASKLPGTWRDF